MGLWSDYKQRRAIADLTERLESVERSLKATRLEWEDTYDRLRRLMGRVAKRALPDEKPDSGDGDGAAAGLDGAASDAGAIPTGTHNNLLTPRQRAIQQDILRRRANIGS